MMQTTVLVSKSLETSVYVQFSLIYLSPGSLVGIRWGFNAIEGCGKIT